MRHRICRECGLLKSRILDEVRHELFIQEMKARDFPHDFSMLTFDCAWEVDGTGIATRCGLRLPVPLETADRFLYCPGCGVRTFEGTGEDE